MTISPSKTALACDGEQLELMCSLTGRILETSDNLMPEDNRFESVVDFVTQTFPIHTVTVNSIIS